MNAIASRHAWRKLAGPSGDGLNPYLTADGVFIGDGASLLEKTADGRFAVRAPEVLEVLLRIGYGGPVEMSGPLRSLSHVAKCLNAGDVGQAHVALAIAGFAPLASTAHARAMREADALGKSWESEPRDYHGRWMSFLSDEGEGGGGESPKGTPAQSETKTGKTKKLASRFVRFFDKVAPLAQRAGKALNIKPEFILGLSAYESGYFGDHAAELNNPFGITHAGGKDVAFRSLDAATDALIHNLAPKFPNGANDMDGFITGLQRGKKYNSKNPAYYDNIREIINEASGRYQVYLNQKN